MHNWTKVGSWVPGWSTLSCDHCEREIDLEDAEVTAIQMGQLDEPKCTCEASKQARTITIDDKEYYKFA